MANQRKSRGRSDRASLQHEQQSVFQQPGLPRTYDLNCTPRGPLPDNLPGLPDFVPRKRRCAPTSADLPLLRAVQDRLPILGTRRSIERATAGKIRRAPITEKPVPQFSGVAVRSPFRGAN